MNALQAFPLRALINNKMESKILHKMTLLKIHFHWSCWDSAKQAEKPTESQMWGGEREEGGGASPPV